MKILRVRQLTQQRWLNLFVTDYQHNDHEGHWVFASRHAEPYKSTPEDAVVIVPILRNPGQPPRLVLIKEFRVPIGDYIYGLPAGLIDEGESVESAIHREIKEETGFDVVKIHRVTQPVYSSSGLTDEATVLAFIDVVGDERIANQPEKSEEIEAHLLDYEGICRIVRDRSLRIDAKAWLILHHYELLGKLE